MAVWFNKQSRLVQILLLLIPGVNWVVEILIRWSAFLHTEKSADAAFRDFSHVLRLRFRLGGPRLVSVVQAPDFASTR